jgi:hypothetical protein
MTYKSKARGPYMIKVFAPGLVGLLILAGSSPARAEAPRGAVEVRECLAVQWPARQRRAPVQFDPVARAVVEGSFRAPKVGDTIADPDGKPLAWASAGAGADGWFHGDAFTGGYAFASIPSDSDRVMILEALGHAKVWVNGEARPGDVYSHGTMKLPVRLRKGENSLLFLNGRGQLRATLVPPRGDGQVETYDVTLPDLLAGKAADTWGAAVVVNATDQAMKGASLRAEAGGGKPAPETPVPALPPLTARKVAFRIRRPAATEPGSCPVALTLVSDQGRTLDTAKLDLRVRRPGETHKRTFLSAIDGSVQYYAVVPSKADASPDAKRPGLILTLHGAGVEGLGQAETYAPKTWAHIVAPTNRRAFGFDWEDWGRLDALEVLGLALEQLDPDPRRVYLSGHSMGGHGTWQLGVLFPDRFAAVAPSAGWISMRSYAMTGARTVEGTSPAVELLRRATLPSDTLAFKANLGTEGVYVLHGSADDNVPVDEAREMRSQLGTFHPDFAYFEQPGAGHWWGGCTDWPPLMEFFRRHELPKPGDVRRVDFVTPSPGVSARSHWAAIEAQAEPFRPSAVHLAFDPKARRFSGTTENVARLALDLADLDPGKPVTAELDGQSLKDVRPPSGETRVWLRRPGKSKTWEASGKPPASLKGPRRGGPFKDAFRNRVVFVYGTRGTPEENAWALARARYDAERFWYQGNASVDVVPDTGFDPSAEPDRNVVVYGHASSHAAWKALLGPSPVQVDRGSVRVGDRTLTGEGLACLLVRPRPGSDVASVGVVGGSGPAGMRLTGQFPYFTSGVAYPDCLVVGPGAMKGGDGGLLAAGFFGEDWGVTSGAFAFGKAEQD